MTEKKTYPIFAAARFNTLLKEKGVSQYKLAKETGLSGSNIFNVSMGQKRPTDEFLAKIASYKPLGITLLMLQLWRNQDEHPPLIMENDIQKFIEQALKLLSPEALAEILPQAKASRQEEGEIGILKKAIQKKEGDEK